MLSGRVSPRAFRRYRVFRWFFSSVLKKFTSMGMQNGDYAERIIQLGADPEKVSITGNLKLALGAGITTEMETGSGRSKTGRQS